jgi:hypothetical protein
MDYTASSAKQFPKYANKNLQLKECVKVKLEIFTHFRRTGYYKTMPPAKPKKLKNKAFETLPSSRCKTFLIEAMGVPVEALETKQMERR